jgi:hypothetical protein
LFCFAVIVQTSKFLRNCALMGILALVLIPTEVLAEMATLRPVADTSLMETAPDNNNGGEAWVLAGTTQNFTRNRGLFLFDFGADIPAGAIIDSVSLQLEVTRQPGDGYNPAPFGLHRVLRPWGEGDKSALDNAGGMGALAEANEATWTHRFAFTPQTWATPGGAPGIDFVADASTEEFIYGIGDSPYTFRSTPALVADAQDWLDHPDSNFGWMLLCHTEEINFTARRFGSRQDPDFGPLLFVEFTPVPEPSTFSLLGAGLAVAGWAGWRLRRSLT